MKINNGKHYSISDNVKIEFALSISPFDDNDSCIEELVGYAVKNGVDDSNWLYRRCKSIIEQARENMLPATVSVPAISFAVKVDTPMHFKRGEYVSGGDTVTRYSVGYARIPDNCTGYYQAFETYAVFSVIEMTETEAAQFGLTHLSGCRVYQDIELRYKYDAPCENGNYITCK